MFIDIVATMPCGLEPMAFLSFPRVMKMRTPSSYSVADAFSEEAKPEAVCR